MIHTDHLSIHGPGLSDFSFPADRALLVVGDVHGQNKALRALLEGMGRMTTFGKRRTLVFLGDLIDRGPDSLGCMRTAIQDAAELSGADEVVHLPGNHELMMADAIEEARRGAGHLGSGSVAESWAINGGAGFIADVFDRTGRTMPDCMAGAVEEFAAMLPHPEHGDVVAMVRSWPSHFRIGDALCVHAGIHPRRPQSETLELAQAAHFPRMTHARHWAWIRDDFLAWQRGWPRDAEHHGDGTLVVHGHSIAPGCSTSMEHGDHLERVFSRMATNARLNLDGGAARGIGVAGAILAGDAARILFSPV